MVLLPACALRTACWAFGDGARDRQAPATNVSKSGFYSSVKAIADVSCLNAIALKSNAVGNDSRRLNVHMTNDAL